MKPKHEGGQNSRQQEEAVHCLEQTTGEYAEVLLWWGPGNDI